MQDLRSTCEDGIESLGVGVPVGGFGVSEGEVAPCGAASSCSLRMTEEIGLGHGAEIVLRDGLETTAVPTTDAHQSTRKLVRVASGRGRGGLRGEGSTGSGLLPQQEVDGRRGLEGHHNCRGLYKARPKALMTANR